jgi:hypothetical protein
MARQRDAFTGDPGHQQVAAAGTEVCLSFLYCRPKVAGLVLTLTGTAAICMTAYVPCLLTRYSLCRGHTPPAV